MNRLMADRLNLKTKRVSQIKLYSDDWPGSQVQTLWDDTMGTAEQNKVYVVQTVQRRSSSAAC